MVERDTSFCVVPKPRLYYDGPCHLCQQSVKWLGRNVPGVRCVPLQSDEAKAVLPEAFVTPPLKGVVVVDGEGHVHLGHKGIRALAPFAKGPWRWALPLVPGWGYRLVARTRYLWGRSDSCPLP